MFCTLLYILFCFLSALLSAVWYYQDSFLYYPQVPEGTRENVPRPNPAVIPYSEDLFITTPDKVKLHCIFLKQANVKDVPTVIYFHGNAGNIGHRLPSSFELFRLGVNVLLVEYRGYGLSEGVPSEWGLKIDAQTALDYLLMRDDVDGKRIIVFGRSLGGAVAVYLAKENTKKVMALVVENTFLSVPKMIDIVMPMFEKVKWMCRNQWCNDKLIKDVTAPILFLSGGSDELIPPSQMKNLHDLATSSRLRRFHLFPSGKHNETWTVPEYLPAVRAFLIEVAGEGTGGQLAVDR